MNKYENYKNQGLLTQIEKFKYLSQKILIN